MQRIKLTIDHHHAVFSRHPIDAAGIEVLDRQNLLPRQRRGGRRQLCGLLDAHEMLAGVKSGRAQQQRKRQICGANRIARQPLHRRCDHVR